jgi:RND family efflux transporter MFP subunit
MIKKVFLWLKKRWIIALVVLLALGGFFLFRNKGNKEVTTAIVQKGLVKEELILTGAINAEKYAALTFPTSGKISWVSVTEGQKVQKGQSLISLDRTTLNVTYQQALNTLRSYQAAAEYALDTVKDHAADETFAQKTTRTTAEVNRDNAYDAVKTAEYNLRNATITAPFAGIVSALPYTAPGVNVLPTATVVEIVDPGTIYFDVDADQSEVIELRDGQEVWVVLDSYLDKELKGKVSFISYTPKAGEAGAVYKVKVTFDKETLGDLMPRIGMTGDAKFVLSQKEDVLNVPVEFVNSDKDGKYVNLGKLGNKVRVETGIEGEETIEIISGVKEGDVLYD